MVPRPLVNDSQAWLVEKGHSALCSSTTIAAAASSSSLTPPPPPPPSPTIIAWADDDPEHPYNFGTSKRATVIVLNIVSVINSTMSSSIPSNAVPYIAAEFGVPSPSSQLVLPISMFLVGYVVGPLIWAPVSEALGRRGPTLLSFACFTAATLACALAPSWPALLVFRLVAGAFASAPIAIVAGMFADVFREPHARGRAFSIIMVVRRFLSPSPCSIPMQIRVPFALPKPGTLTTSTEHRLRPADRADHLRLRVTLDRMAVVVLDRADL